MPTLSAEKVTAGYGGGPPILDGVSVRARAGSIVVVLGPNGAGKSTLAKAIVGQIKPRSGRVTLDGKDLTGLSTHQVVRCGVAYLPQTLNVFDQMNVLENLEMGGYIRRDGLRDRIESILELFPDLAVDRKKRAGTLSGGQQRMLALARLLMTDPDIAILDEPTAGLSPVYAESVWDRLQAIAARGVGLLVIEQNAHTAMERSDEVYLLAQGQNVLSGEATTVRERPEVAKILVG